MKERLLGVLTEERTLQRGYFRPEAVRALVDEHLQERRNRSGLLWRMLVLELWHRRLESGEMFRNNRSAPEIARATAVPGVLAAERPVPAAGHASLRG